MRSLPGTPGAIRTRAPLGGQDSESVLRGRGHLGIGVRAEAPQLRFQAVGPDVPRDDQDDRQVLTAADCRRRRRQHGPLDLNNRVSDWCCGGKAGGMGAMTEGDALLRLLPVAHAASDCRYARRQRLHLAPPSAASPEPRRRSVAGAGTSDRSDLT